MKTTLNDYLNACRILGKERNIYVDGIDGICYCGTQLTEEGQKHFAQALTLEMYDNCVTGTDRDYELEEEGQPNGLSLAWEMLSGMAGYCSCSDWDKWFID